MILLQKLTRGVLAALLFAIVSSCSNSNTAMDRNTAESASSGETPETVTVTLAYPYGDLFTDVHEQIVEKFEAENPNIDIELQAPLANYENLAQRTLVGITQRQAPTISFQGINQVRQFVDAGHATDLSEFVAADSCWSDGGLYENMMALLGNLMGRSMRFFSLSQPPSCITMSSYFRRWG